MNKPAPELTICIPCAPSHADLVVRAIDSCAAQIDATGAPYPVYYGVEMDTQGKGPGWARNQMISKVNTPYITFLDADDWLEPLYAVKMVEAAHRAELAGRYVYCGWIEDFPATNMMPARSDNIEAPAKPWCGLSERDSHLITSIYPTQWIQMLGGFDETLPGLEDVELAWKVRAAGHCGERLNEFLIHYTDHGARSDAFRQRTDRDKIVQDIRDKYRGANLMACCSDAPIIKAPVEGRQTGDVLARWMPAPVVSGYQGRATGRRYHSAGYGAELWMHPQDALQDPVRFQIIPLPAPRPPEVATPITMPPMPRQGVISTAEEIAQAMQPQIRQGADVYLPQNELGGPKGKIDMDTLRKLASKK